MDELLDHDAIIRERIIGKSGAPLPTITAARSLLMPE
jgi:hypothetical protein